MPKTTEIKICHDCKKAILPPYGKPFSNGDGKTRCAGCAVHFYLKHPGAGIELEGYMHRRGSTS